MNDSKSMNKSSSYISVIIIGSFSHNIYQSLLDGIWQVLRSIKKLYSFTLIGKIVLAPLLSNYDAPRLTKITLDIWRYFGQVEVLWTTGGTLDNWRCSRQLEVLSTTGGTFDNWMCSRQLEVPWRTGGALDTWRYFR